jgi:hypothetical protein
LVTTEGTDCGWTLKSDKNWHDEPLNHVKAALESTGIKPTDVKMIIGAGVFKPWALVNLPFQSEYPGDRKWNRHAVQFKFLPNLKKEDLTYPTWSRIITHIGSSLDSAVQEHAWCKINGLKSGADYLKCWISSLFQSPLEPLPYLFLYGPQGSGKSILHEALSLLITGGYQRADAALVNSSGFDAELEHAILCVVEETDLKQNKVAYNRIKDWVTSLQLLIHRKGETPYHVVNTTHWIQCSNNRSACPVFAGDTRITMCYVPELESEIPKREIIALLEKEAPDFLGEVLRLELPKSATRLGLPVIETDDKTAASKINMTLLETYIEEKCYYSPGSTILLGEFYDDFIRWLEPNDRYDWSKIRVSREMPPMFVKGRNKEAQWCYGNISFEKPDPATLKQPKLIVRGERLMEAVHEN